MANELAASSSSRPSSGFVNNVNYPLFKNKKCPPADDVHDINNLFVHCLSGRFEIPLNFPLLKLEVVRVHVSLPGDGGKWDILLLDNDGVFDNLENMEQTLKIPTLIAVDESCLLQWTVGTTQFQASTITKWRTLARIAYVGGGPDEWQPLNMAKVDNCKCVSIENDSGEDGGAGDGDAGDDGGESSDAGDGEDAGGDGDDTGGDGDDTGGDGDETGGDGDDTGGHGDDTGGDGDDCGDGEGGNSDNESDGDGRDRDDGQDGNDGDGEDGDNDAGDDDDNDEEDSSDEESTEEEDEEEQWYGEVIKLSGSHKEQRYQKTLEEVKLKIKENNMNIEHVPVKIERQPGNIADRNAITVLIDIENNGNWKEVGTIPKKKIVKITNVLRDNELRKCTLHRPPYAECVADGVSYVCLSCELILQKVGKWPSDSKHYSYDQYV